MRSSGFHAGHSWMSFPRPRPRVATRHGQLGEKKPGFWERRRKKREEEGFHARVKVLEETYREEEKVPALQEPGGSYAVTTLLQAPARQDYLQEGEEIYLLYDEEMVIGRGEECAIRVDSEQVSRQHARLRRADDRWYVRDLRSRNGSWLNDKRHKGDAPERCIRA